MFAFIVKHWQIPLIIILWLVSLILLKKLGNKLEHINRSSFSGLWLAEIGSDVRLYGRLSSTVLCLNWLLRVLINNSVVDYYLTKINYVVIGIWGLLVLIAGLVQGQTFYQSKIQSSSMLEIDKRNFLTLIPVIASIIKLILYILFIVYCLHLLKVDVAPILNVGGIMLAALTFAGSDTIKSVLATLKIFLTRRYYVGSDVKINNLKRGVIVSITIIDTTVRTETGDLQVIDNNEVKQVIVYHNPTD